jgi:uncharacterized protein YqhQ
LAVEVGGQAVIEGVLMRRANAVAVVCRRPSGELVVREGAHRRLAPGWVNKIPILRGAIVLVESLTLGLEAISFAAEQQLSEEEKQKRGGASVGAALLFSALVGVGLLIVAPHLATWAMGFRADRFAFHAVDGLIKIAIFLAYLAMISRLPDVRRLFAYHGAEHKAIATFEAKLPLTVENARSSTRFHARCGTSLVLLVVLVGILLSSVALRHPLSGVPLYDHLLKILIKVPLMLPIAGLAYEALKIGGKNANNPLLRPLVLPGLWLQRLTTREPDDAQLEVALVAARLALARGDEAKDPAPRAPLVTVFASPSDIHLPLTF